MEIECRGPIDLSSIESKYRLFFECAQDMVFLVDVEGNIRDANYAVIKEFEYTREELLSMNIRDLRAPTERSDAGKKLKEAFEKGAVYETVHMRKSGTTFPVEISSRGLVLENDKLILAIVRDITKRKEAERNNARLAAIVESTDDAVFSVTMDGIIMDWNRGAEAMYGYKGKEMRGRSIDLIIPEDHTGELYHILNLIRQGGRLKHFDTERVRKDGERIFVSMTASPIKNDRGELMGISWIARDITDLKNAREAMDKRLVSLTQPEVVAEVSLTDLFDLEEIQKIQDAFAETMNVASIITYPDGTPITRPSNFRRLCMDIIRKTRTGCANCLRSDAIIGRENLDGPIIQPCLSGGLWDAGASITVGGKHIANWLIGQVKNEAIDEKKVILYADEIGADREEFRKALSEVPVMPIERFREIAKFLFILAKELSLKAYQNVRQARFIAERKRAEEALERQASMIDLSPDGIIVRQLDGRISFWSKGAESLYGWTREEAIGQKAHILLKTRFPEPLAKIVGQLQQTGHWSGELTHTRKDGRQVIVQSWWLSHSHRRGNEGEILESNVDITERKHAELELEKTNRALRAVSRCNEAMIHIADEQALLNAICNIIVDIGGYRMTWIGYAYEDKDKTVQPVAKAGYEQGYIENVKVTWADTERGRGPAGTAIRTKKPSVIKNVMSNPSFAPWRSEAIKRGYASVISLPLITNDHAFGVLTIYSGKTDVFDEGEMVLLKELADDLAYGITSIRSRIEREHAREAQLESEERLRLAQQVAQIGTFELDLQTGMNKWTPELESMYGLPRGGFPWTQEAWERLVYPEDRKTAAQKVREAIEKGHFEGEWRVVWPDGTVHWLYGRGQVFKDRSGKPLRLLGVNIDITERKQAEEALQNAKAQAELYLDLMGHDITNMNQALLGYLEIMEVKRESGTIEKELIDSSVEIINRSSRMIEDVKKLTQVRTGKVPLKRVDVCEILSAVKSRYSGLPGRKVTIKYTPGHECMVGGSDLLEDVLNNLVDNAIRHSTGPIAIDLAVDRVTVEERSYYRITVADTGPGIPDNLKKKILLPLKQSQDKTERRGFGLYLVRTLVDYYHGRVWVEDRVPGDYTKGARFVVLLPAVK